MATSPSKTDLMYEIVYNPKFVLSQSPKVNVKSSVVDGKPSYLMKNHASGTYYDLDEPTNLIWNLVDGKRTINQIVKETQKRKADIQERTVIETLLFFAEAELLQSSLETKKKKRFRVVSPFEIDLTLVENTNNFIQSLHSRIHPIFKRLLLYVVIAFIVAGGVLFAAEFVSIYGQKGNFEILGSSVVGFFFYYFVALAPVITVHEIAHAITLVHYGGKAGEMGTGLFYFGPMFYAETTDAWGLRRRHRIMVYLAGNISTLLIGSALVIVHLTVQIPGFASHIILMVAFYCFSMSLMNFAPPFETDGYYMLSDIVNMPNLRRDSYGYLGSVVKRVFRRKTNVENSDLSSKKKRIFILYALLSVGWITYIVFQTTLFLVYMSQDVTAALTNIGSAILSSQAIPATAIVIAVASTLYFGMQITGYGFVFSAAVRKATRKPLTVEAIHDRDVAVLGYLPPQVPQSLSNSLKSKMERIAKKFTTSVEMRQVGRSCIATLRIGSTNLALVQIREHLNRIENEFTSAYQNFILRNRHTIQSSAGVYAPNKIKLTHMLRQIAAESVDAGNSSALQIARSCVEAQKENILYLLQSASGTVWTIEVQPAQEYDIEKQLVPSLLLEDITLTDLYRDTENFKKRIVYGYDSLATFANDIETGVKECLARPDKYQLTCVMEPVKSRITLIGRTEEIEQKVHMLAPIFAAHTWSGYLENLLCETCFKLKAINRAYLPNAKEMENMTVGELTVLAKDLRAFKENQEVIDRCVEDTEKRLVSMSEDLTNMKKDLRTEKFKIGMLDAVFQVNIENRLSLPSRIKEFRREWKILCARIEKIREHVDRRYEEKKPVVSRRKRQILLVSPFIIILSASLFAVGLQPSLAQWTIVFAAVAVGIQALYWGVAYSRLTSFRKATRYSNQHFNDIHLTLLATAEAVYPYVATGDIVTSI